jgi:uncharacterized membrane protein YidH (DUF202 family)
MWFRLLSLVIAVALLGKATIALAMPRRFYAERQRQFASASPPAKIVVPPVMIVFITAVAWYATIFHYQPWGWIVTGALTALACLAIAHLSRWERHRHRMLRLVSSPNVQRTDYLLLVVGAVFVMLALLVY